MYCLRGDSLGSDTKPLSERDICTKFILPAVQQADWDSLSQVREEVSCTKGGIIVRQPARSGSCSLPNQAITGLEDSQKLCREFSPNFFDRIVIDECHRGSADADSACRDILDHFSSATQIGLTATLKETRYVSNIDYLGKPVFSYKCQLEAAE